MEDDVGAEVPQAFVSRALPSQQGWVPNPSRAQVAAQTSSRQFSESRWMAMIMITVDDWDYTLTVGKTNRNRFGSLEIAKSREPEQDVGKAPPRARNNPLRRRKDERSPGQYYKAHAARKATNAQTKRRSSQQQANARTCETTPPGPRAHPESKKEGKHSQARRPTPAEEPACARTAYAGLLYKATRKPQRKLKRISHVSRPIRANTQALLR